MVCNGLRHFLRCSKKNVEHWGFVKIWKYISQYFFLADIEEEQMSSRKIYPGQKSPGQL